ncbi:toprim domain-containing protein [Chlamydiales bacterium]|nr:toprim domain-containing protein [Chlamydiales bacterium]
MSFQSSNFPRDYEGECIEHMHANGIFFDSSLKCDGKLHRFSMDAKKHQPDEWYVCHEGTSLKGSPYLTCTYGTWSGGQEGYVYRSYVANKTLSNDELFEVKTREKERRKLFDQQREEDQANRVRQAFEVWEQSIEQPTLPGHLTYLERKQVKAYGIKYRVEKDGDPVIIIPLCNIEGEFQAIQKIHEDGTKRINGAKKGNFHLIGSIEEDRPLYVVEGYATGASIHEATNSPVVVTFDCGNLKSVVLNLREKYPTANLIVAADDDRKTPGNPGKNKAEEAAKAYGCALILPVFPKEAKLPLSGCFTDFNDLQSHLKLP